MKTNQQTNIFIKRLFLSLFLSTVMTYQAKAVEEPIFHNVSNANVIALGQSIHAYKSQPRNCEPGGITSNGENSSNIESSTGPIIFGKSQSATIIANFLAARKAVGNSYFPFKDVLDELLIENKEGYTADSSYHFYDITAKEAPYPRTEELFEETNACEFIMRSKGDVWAGLGKVDGINGDNNSYWSIILFHEDSSFEPCSPTIFTPCNITTIDNTPVEDNTLELKGSISSSSLP